MRAVIAILLGCVGVALAQQTTRVATGYTVQLRTGAESMKTPEGWTFGTQHDVNFKPLIGKDGKPIIAHNSDFASLLKVRRAPERHARKCSVHRNAAVPLLMRLSMSANPAPLSFPALAQINGKLYIIAQQEAPIPANFYLWEVTQDAATGKLTNVPGSLRAVDTKSVNGSMVMCSGHVSPWWVCWRADGVCCCPVSGAGLPHLAVAHWYTTADLQGHALWRRGVGA
jgi:hypothetical protein